MGAVAKTIMLRIAAGALWLMPTAALAQLSNEYLVVDLDPKHPAKEGNGFDSGRLVPLSAQCIAFKNVEKGVPDQGQSDFKVLRTVSDIKSSFNISYRTAMSTLLGDESTSTAFGESLHFNDDKVSGVFHKVITISPETVNGVSLAPGVPTDPSDFHRVCGDYYVAGFTKGYEFHGFVEVSKSLFSSDTSFETKLEEAVNSGLANESTNVEAKATLDMMFSSRRVSAREQVTGGGLGAMKGTNLKTVMDDYQNFPPKGSQATNLKVIIAPYPPSAPIVSSPDEALLEENAKLWLDFYELGKQAEGAKKQTGLYYYFDTAGQPIKKPAVAATGALINALQQRISAQVKQCGTGPGKCKSMRSSLQESETPEALRERLPVYVGYASSCTEMAQTIRRSFNDRTFSPADGQYTLYWQRNPKWDYLAYCDDINGSARTYFSLGTPGRAPDDKRQGINFFQIAPSGSGAKENWYNGSMVTSVYDMVEIDPVSMQVINSKDSAGRHDSGKIKFNNDDTTSVAFGKVGECDDAVADQAKGRIDLKRTNFRVAEKSTLLKFGYHPDGGDIRFLEDRQVVDLSSPKGYCAGVDGPIYLEPKSDLQ
jgi:hypothetical protein